MPSLLQPQPKASKPDKLEEILAVLTPIQRAFVTDSDRFKVARCGRRSGKTYGLAALMHYTAIKYPKCKVVYFGLTLDSAVEAVWEPLTDFVNDLNIECEVIEGTKTIKYPSKSSIRLYGADMKNLKNRFRGRKYKLVGVDECAFYAAIDDIVTNVLLATLADLAGSLVMTSSPGLTRKGLFYDADVGKQKEHWKQYTWTMYDNPHFQKPAHDPKYPNRVEEELDTICRLKFGGDRNNPSFRREYLGEWVFDDISFVYPLPPMAVHPLGVIPYPEYAVGVNLSRQGIQAFTVLRFSDYSSTCDVVEAFATKHRTLDKLADQIRVLAKKYTTHRVLAYLGKQSPDIIDEFRARYTSYITASEYEKTPFYQSIIATEMQLSNISVSDQCANLVDEFSSIVMDDKGGEAPDQETLLSDAFFACYINLHLKDLKSRAKPETEEERIERTIIESLEDTDAYYQ